MSVKQQIKKLEDQVIKGLEEAYKRMVILKKQKNSPLIVSRNGEVIEIRSEEILPTITYKR